MHNVIIPDHKIKNIYYNNVLMNKIKTKNKLEIIIITLISIITVIFWDTYLVYPFKIFAVLLHEVSHALTTIFSGGTVAFIKIDSSLSGITVVKGGNPILIAASGYLGSLTLGSILFLSAKYVKLRLWYTSILALILFLSAVNLIEGGVSIFITLVISIIFFLIPRYLNEKVNKITLSLIGLTSCFYIIADIKQDLFTTTLRETDTQVLEYLTGIPAITFGILWFIISITVVYFLIRNAVSAK
jgi:hypothetical protein